MIYFKLKQKSTKILRIEMYKYIESLLDRELEKDEKNKISKIFIEGIKKYFETTTLNS